MPSMSQYEADKDAPAPARPTRQYFAAMQAVFVKAAKPSKPAR